MEDTGIGARIREARLRAKLTQRQVARAGDLDVMQVSRWERGATKRPTAESLKRLAKALGVSVDWLLTGTEAAA